MTLDEWKAQQAAKKEGPKFNLRKAGEGSDLDPKWKKTYAYKKERETYEDDEDEVSDGHDEHLKLNFSESREFVARGDKRFLNLDLIG